MNGHPSWCAGSPPCTAFEPTPHYQVRRPHRGKHRFGTDRVAVSVCLSAGTDGPVLVTVVAGHRGASGSADLSPDEVDALADRLRQLAAEARRSR